MGFLPVKSRIPVTPLTSEKSGIAIEGELIIDLDNNILKVKNGDDIIDLTTNTTGLFKTGRFNMIKGTAFNDEVVPDNFNIDGFVMLSINRNGYLTTTFLNSEARFIVNLSDPIIKNYEYILSFYAHVSEEVNIRIIVDNNIQTNMKLNIGEHIYSYIIDSSELSTDSIKQIIIEVDKNCSIDFSKMMLESGKVLNEWIETATYNLTISRLIASNVDVLDILTIRGIPITEILSNVGGNTVSNGDNIVTDDEFLEEQTLDSNYDTVCATLGSGENEIICNKTFEDLIYGTYYVILRLKSSDITYADHPLLTITTSEFADDELNLLSTTDIYATDLTIENEYEEIGFITKFYGNHGPSKKNLNITVNMIGNYNNPKVNIDYISIGMAAPGILPIETIYE